MTMIEKVARALYERESKRRKHTVGSNILLPWDECKTAFMEDACVAIEAMRDPSEEILNAFGGHYGFSPPENRDKALPKWHAMIDAALKEE